MDLKHIKTLGRTVMACKTSRGNPIKVDEFVYPHGLGLTGYTLIRFDLKRAATKFLADVSLEGPSSWVYAQLYVDGKKVDDKRPRLNPKGSSSPIIYQLSADLKGASELVVVFAASGHSYSLGGARILLVPDAKERPEIVPLPDEQAKLMGDPDKVVWVQEMNPMFISSGDGRMPGIMSTQGYQPLLFGGKIYGNGYSVYPRSRLMIDLKGNAARFFAQVGVNDSTSPSAKEGAQFKVYSDKKVAYDSGVMHAGDALKSIDLDLAGTKELLLAVDGGENATKNLPIAVWVGPRLLVSDAAKNPKDLKSRPEPKLADQVPMVIARIVDGPKPAVHGPRVAGASPGRPFLFVIPATGEKPLKFTSTTLPSGLKLDPATGTITGRMDEPLQSVVTITVSNALGQVSRPLTIICKPYGMLPTPPMGWNHWNQWTMIVTEARVREAVDALVAKGLAAHGYNYINLDEGWQGPRAADGSITGAKEQGFADMKALGDYIHGKGLKFGIYSSPGAVCCSGRPGSRDHEQQDADTWASWGVDYLKYDRCTGGDLHWKSMRNCLDNTGRDFVYSTGTCRDPAVNAQLWRTTGDIKNSWSTVSDIGFIQQAGLEKLAGPGRFNDPDMLVIGNPDAMRTPRTLTHNEQITHFTLWSILAAPLLFGCDLTKADDFFVSLTCNDDVLDVNQDPLVRQGSCFRKDPASGSSDMGGEVWTRPLFDGTKAVALFNRGSEPVEIGVTWKELGLTGPQPVRDCWQRKDLGNFDTGFSVRVEVHAAVLIKVGKPQTDRYDPVPRS